MLGDHYEEGTDTLVLYVYYSIIPLRPTMFTGQKLPATHTVCSMNEGECVICVLQYDLCKRIAVHYERDAYARAIGRVNLSKNL